MADRTALARATDSSDSPTPGYLYLDIAKSVAASPVACGETVAYLSRRLTSHKNHNVKYKCCKVMGMVAASPVTRGVFKREIVKDTAAVSAIKECLSYSGKADPVHGDALYQKVRDAAKECLDIVYSDDSSNTMEYNGADTYNSGGGSNNPYSSGGGKRMEGIGNPMFADPRSIPESKGIGQMTISEAFQTAKEGFKGIINDPFAKNVPSAPPSRYGGVGNTQNTYGGSSSHASSSYGRQSYSNSGPPPGQRELSQATNGKWNMASNRGPNAYRPNMAPVSTTSVGGSWASTSTNTNSSSVASMARDYSSSATNVGGGSGGSAVKDGSYEKQLVAELCPPGGMKAEPPEDKLKAFQEAIPNLDADFVCPALLDCLEEGQPWIIRAKALCVMEVTLNTPAYSDFFHACASEIQPLAQHPRAAVKNPARRILSSLGIQLETSTATSNPPSQAKPPAAAPPPPAADLLDFGDAPPPLPDTAPPPAPPPPPPTSNNDMFGGMNLKLTPAPTTTTTTDNVGDLLETNAAVTTAAPAAPESSSNMFGDMNVKDNSMFGDMNIKETKSTESATSATAAPSAFSFIQSDAPASPKPAAPAPPAKQSFDPLLNMNTSQPARTMNTNNMMFSPQQQMMAMSNNAQMQAAFLQQQQQMMMMMQHMQMQQAKMPVMGGSPASGAGGVTTSFAFMDDPAKAKKEQQNKSFDFVKDAMKGAK